ncbi:MAG: T9SS type A sorting domain-containing protein [Bacteroidia bacterium]
MKNKISLPIFLAVLLTSFNAAAFKITSVRDGSWFNDSTWDALQLPVAGDSVYIDHFVTAENLDIADGEVVFINLNGTVCCNHVVHTFCNSFLTIRGKLRTRYFDVEGIVESSGDLKCDSARLHNCAYMHSTGAIHSGPYDCSDPGSDTTTVYPPPLPTDSIHYDCNFSAHPSPFTDNFLIKFSIPRSQNVVVELFDLNGRKIQTVLNNYFEAREFSGTINCLKELPPGIYIIRMTCSLATFNRKMIHL